MKKQLFRLAAGLLAMSCSGLSMAQSTVTVYGMLDTFVERTDVGAYSANRVGSSGLFGSRLGFKGNEDLGGGLRASFALEHGLNTDSGTAADSARMFNRQSWVSLASRDLGELRLGRQTSPMFFTEGQIDAFFGASIASGLNNLSLYQVRQDKTIGYISPTVAGGLSAELYYGRPTTGAGYTGKTRQAALRYINGPLYLAAVHQKVDTTPSGSSALASTYLGGHYEAGVLTYYLALHQAKLPSAGIDRRVVSASVKWFVQPNLALSLGYTTLSDRTALNNDATDIGFLAHYLLSKRTSLYGALSRIDNRNTASFTLMGAAIAGQPLSAPGADPRGIQFGIVHAF